MKAHTHKLLVSAASEAKKGVSVWQSGFYVASETKNHSAASNEGVAAERNVAASGGASQARWEGPAPSARVSLATLDIEARPLAICYYYPKEREERR